MKDTLDKIKQHNLLIRLNGYQLLEKVISKQPLYYIQRHNEKHTYKKKCSMMETLVQIQNMNENTKFDRKNQVDIY